MQAAKDSIFHEPEFFVPQALKDAKDFGETSEAQSYLALRRAASAEDLVHMREVIVRTRMQIRSIIFSVRCWQERHEGFDNPLRLRYSGYEGAFCYADLRRHWQYYRHAMKEYGVMRG